MKRHFVSTLLPTLLAALFCVGSCADCDILSRGGYIQRNLVIGPEQSPCRVSKTAVVGSGYVLTIQPGVEMQFAPGVMLAVNGTLLAKGTPSNRITMTKVPNPDGDRPPSWPSDIRLVDEFSVTYGRLEVLYHSKWRGICANAVNWTQTDVDVSCRQLGFKTGNFSFYSYATNDTSFMLYYQPKCTGKEKSVLDCPGSRGIKIGSRICRNQMTIWLNCTGLAPDSPAKDYWWGLEFYNSTISITVDDILQLNESSSILSNVNISYAGVAPNMQPVPAIRASPTIPALINVSISSVALDGTNFTGALSPTIIYNSEITNCRGNGIHIQTNMGRVEIKKSRVVNNYGNGIKAKFLDNHFFIVDELMTFCKMANIGKQTFPQLITGIPTVSTSCGRRFEAKTGMRLTMNVLEMEIEQGCSGTLEVYDGRDATSPQLATYPILNGTLPMGISSTFWFMFVRFTWNIPPGKVCVILKDCVKFTILVDISPNPETKAEFFMNDTIVSNNLQHGMFLENMRNYIVVNSSVVTHNGYGAGIRVYSGAGDVLVNASVVNWNQNNGVNITYDGGWRIFNQSSFSHNYGNGINITTNETRCMDNRTTRYTRHQRTEVMRSQFIENEGFGIRIGNYCRSAWSVVNDSLFRGNWLPGVEFDSCYKIVPQANASNFTVGYSIFDSNRGHAIRITPMLNAFGRISNNTFVNHTKHVLLINNGQSLVDDHFFMGTYVEYVIEANKFTGNKGVYVVNVRLTDGSLRQRMDVRYNIFRGNEIQGYSSTLNERTQSYAVVIMSSRNIYLVRNHLENPDSEYEVGTHLYDLSVTLSASLQWWGTTDYTVIVQRIFDQFCRYDLAYINYAPALAYDWLYTPVLTDRHVPVEVAFARGDRLGGRLANEFHTTPGMTYRVDRDISVLGWGLLYISPGTTLEFGNCLGMLVEGYVNFQGTADQPITVKLANESTWINHTLIRLVGGPSYVEGRLEVRPTEFDEWGTVCNDSWTMQDASVACQMMGLVVDIHRWKSPINIPGDVSQTIWRSSVRCSKYDFDLMTCDADDQYDHSCSHDLDVYVTCMEPTWAGIRFLASAQPSVIRYAEVSGAGLSDPSAVIYAPAIRIDYNVHTLDHVTVFENMDDGIVIMHNDVYANARLSSSVVRDNVGNGVTVRASFFDMYDCRLLNNGRAGFEYSPMYTARDALQIRAGIRSAIVLNQTMSIKLQYENRQFVITPRKYDAERTTYDLEVEVSPQYKVVVDLIDFNPDISAEQVIVYDSRRSQIRDGTVSWRIDEDLVDFPVVSQLTYMTIRWQISGISSGRLAFVVRSKPWNWDWPFPTLSLRNSTVEGNSHGVVTRHYNQPTNEWLDIFSRYRWETIRMYGLVFRANLYESVHALSITRYNVLYMPTFEELQRALRIAEIHYTVEACLFERNGGGILAEHNHVEFSNNVWIWQIMGDRFERNLGGGYMIELPRVNLMYSDLYNHSVDINDTVFYDNDNFAFRIDGFYCNSTIVNNMFQRNRCQVGCITFAGTEKDLDMRDNQLIENTGRYILEFNMNSHTPFTQWVESHVENNIIKRNTRPDGLVRTATSQPTTYAVGIRGVQNVTVNRNLIVNPDMDFELLGGQASSRLENYLDVTMNWWGTINQIEIIDRIFDFDDWNSFAIAEYCPFLTSDSFSALAPLCQKIRPVLDLSQPFGGRITENLRLPRRSLPYVIKSDLTVMSGVSMIIEAGAELQFYPNVGILVLGSLVANGNPTNRIKFGPVPKPQLKMNRMRRATGLKPPAAPVEKLHHPDINWRTGYEIKFVGGPNPDEGFIQIYNNTERRWALICDRSFNDRTAEVACRTAGKESSNVIVRRSPYYDIFVLGYPKMHEQVLEWFWRETLICDGRESSMDQCRYKINYQLPDCMLERQYVYVRCGPRNLPDEYDYWGNIRFSNPNYEMSKFTAGYNSLSYVDVYGAGILHDDRVAAIQSIYRVASSDSVRVHHCNYNGYDYVAPRSPFQLLRGTIENNNGYAVAALVLNSDSSDQTESQFIPLNTNTAPYNVYGLIRMCSAEKLMYIVDRVLLYHKYTFDTIDCVKIIRSKEPHKQISLRFLQVQIYNDSYYRNAIEMYNGEFFDPRQRIGEVTVNSTLSERRRRYFTSPLYDTMGIRVTGSPAFEAYGFIAEVVTLPQSPGDRPDFGPGKEQRIAYTSMTDNLGGGFIFSNVGDNNPRVIFESNTILQCGYGMLNITSPPLVNIFIQNTRMLTVSNNFIGYSAGGGILVNTTTKDNEVAIHANITNNVIMRNTHGEALHVEGHQYQGFDVKYNYIANNDGDYRNTIAAFGVQMNFSTNIVVGNRAQCIVNASVLEKISINQRYVRNAIYDNWAFAINQSTIFLKSAKFLFNYNYLVNPLNVYEMVMYNRTKYPYGEYPSVDAQFNWWGGSKLSYVAGRIWERRDDDNLIQVDYDKNIQDNSTILSGKCYPGWRQFDNKCYWYFGGVTTYSHATTICKVVRGRLAWARDPKGREANLGQLVSQFQFNSDVNWLTWIYSDKVQDERKCTVLRDYKVELAKCELLLPFICERDPFVQTRMDWVPVIVICSIVGSILVFVILPLMLFACIKSSQRKKEKIDRRVTLERSLAASRESLASRAMRASRESLNTDLDEKRKPRPNVDLSLSTVKYNGAGGATAIDYTTESFDKPKYDYDFYRPTSPLSSGDFVSTKWDEDSTYYDDDPDYPMAHGAGRLGAVGGLPLVENEIVNVPHRYQPSADLPPPPPSVFDIPGYRRPDYDEYRRPDLYADDRSVSHSLVGHGGGGSRRPGRPQLPSYSADIALGAVDEAESLVSSRPNSEISGAGGGNSREQKSRPPRPRIA